MFHIVVPVAFVFGTIRIVKRSVTMTDALHKLSIISISQSILRARHSSDEPDVLTETMLNTVFPLACGVKGQAVNKGCSLIPRVNMDNPRAGGARRRWWWEQRGAQVGAYSRTGGSREARRWEQRGAQVGADMSTGGSTEFLNYLF